MISYIISTYGGQRVGELAEYSRDKAIYLRYCIESLRNFKHSLIKEILIIANEPPPSLDWVPNEICGIPVHKHIRPNTGFSYGALAFGVEIAQEPYVILSEDDYVFTQNNFDKYLLDKVQDNGFLCGGAWPCQTAPVSAAIFIGISPKEVVRKALENGWNGQPVFSSHPSTYADGWYTQSAWAMALETTGYRVCDWLSDYSSAYWDSQYREIRWYTHGGPGVTGDFETKSLIAPVQALILDRVSVSNNQIRATAKMNSDGTLSFYKPHASLVDAASAPGRVTVDVDNVTDRDSYQIAMPLGTEHIKIKRR